MPVSTVLSMRRSWRVVSLFLAIGLVAAAQSSAIAASAGAGAGASGLPVPRFVSLKAGRVNVRIGPGEDYKIAWVFTRPGLPIEVIQEFANWRRIRDSDGTVGWVFQSLLAGKRTAVVAPWASDDPRLGLAGRRGRSLSRARRDGGD